MNETTTKVTLISISEWIRFAYYIELLIFCNWIELNFYFLLLLQGIEWFFSDLSYNIALCFYSLKQYAPALKHIADIIERGIREHPGKRKY